MNWLAFPTLCFVASAALAQVTFPNDFETGSPRLDPLSSYFGGVGAFGARASGTTVYAGGSLELWANFQHDSFFHIAGVQFGLLNQARASLGYPGGADTLSITVRPPDTGRFQMIITLREDDDGDGLFDPEADDEWETAPMLLSQTTSVYNIPVSSLTLANPGAGNGILQLATTPRLGVVLTLETRASLPGGIVEVPASFLVDHFGLYVGNQTLPAPACPADLDGGQGNGLPDGAVTVEDMLYYLGAYEAGAAPADLDNGSGIGQGDGAVTIDDLLFFLGHFEAGC